MKNILDYKLNFINDTGLDITFKFTSINNYLITLQKGKKKYTFAYTQFMEKAISLLEYMLINDEKAYDFAKK